MGIVLACLIFGLAAAIERIIYLNLATTNTQKTNEEAESALNQVEQKQPKKYAEHVWTCSINLLSRFRPSWRRWKVLKKLLLKYGGVQMGKLEKCFLDFSFYSISTMLELEL